MAVTSEKLAALAVQHGNLGIGAVLASNMLEDAAVDLASLVIGFAPAYVTEDLTESDNILAADGDVFRNESTAKTLDGHYVSVSGSIDMRFVNAAGTGAGDTVTAVIASQTDGGSWVSTGSAVNLVSVNSTSYQTFAFPSRIVGPFSGSVKFAIAVGVSGGDPGHYAKVDDSRMQVVGMVNK